VAAGWWSVAPGETVYAFETNNRYFCFYGEAEDGRLWTGDRVVHVLDERFYQCWKVVSYPSYAVEMELVDAGNVDVFTRVLG
jgi:hypothetical protein